MKKLLPLLGLCLLAAVVWAAPPAWWTEPATKIIDPDATESNSAPANLGHLKNVATQANKHLAGTIGSGSVSALTGSFTNLSFLRCFSL
jgi:hypothetical protein